MPSVWRIATDAPTYAADDLGGEGARLTGGRWNRRGKAMVYASSTIALACLETVVHLVGSAPLNRYLVEIVIPDTVWRRAVTFDANASDAIGWDALPASKVSLDVGDEWLRANTAALLFVPSAVIPEERNALINPAHPDTADIDAKKRRRFLYDPRMIGEIR